MFAIARIGDRQIKGHMVVLKVNNAIFWEI